MNVIRKDSSLLKKRNKVYFLIKNIRIKRPSKKLDYIKVRLFLIKEERGLVNYKLKLLKGLKRYPVFHILLFGTKIEQRVNVDSLRYLIPL